jgi:hypothetical protein
LERHRTKLRRENAGLVLKNFSLEAVSKYSIGILVGYTLPTFKVGETKRSVNAAKIIWEFKHSYITLFMFMLKVRSLEGIEFKWMK